MNTSCCPRLSNIATALVAFRASVVAVSAQTPAGPTATVSESGPHHRVWEWTEVDEQGQTNVHAYTELATGLNFFNPVTGQFEESESRFDITADGHAVAQRGQHQVILTPDVNAPADGTELFTSWYDRRSDTNNSLIDVYGRWGTIAGNGDVTFSTNDFRISTTNFPPVFAGTDTNNLTDGHYDPVYPPGNVNLHWHYEDWPPDDPPVFHRTAPSYIGHVGEYDGAWAEGQYVYVTWTDNRVSSAGTIYARNQRDIRFARITWP